MKFEPTYDYGQTDLNKEENLVLWKFGELIKNLITIASDADKQRYIMNIGIATDDMALDFDAYFTSPSSKQYLEYKLLSQEAFDEFVFLYEIFDKNSGDRNPDFWDDSLLDTNKDWNDVRLRAKKILELIKMSNLDIECFHYDMIEEGEVIGQRTITRLVNKKT